MLCKHNIRTHTHTSQFLSLNHDLDMKASVAMFKIDC